MPSLSRGVEIYSHVLNRRMSPGRGLFTHPCPTDGRGTGWEMTEHSLWTYCLSETGTDAVTRTRRHLPSRRGLWLPFLLGRKWSNKYSLGCHRDPKAWPVTLFAASTPLCCGSWQAVCKTQGLGTENGFLVGGPSRSCSHC